VDAQHPPVERELAFDLVKRGLPIAPVIILAAGLLRGWDGAASAAVAIGIVFVNFLAAAAIMTWASSMSPGAVGGAAAAGFAIRLLVILVALILLKNVSWIDMPTLGIVLVGTHVGLLAWEAKYVSMTLAAPGLRPQRPVRSGEE
jgi:hypothetical protein